MAKLNKLERDAAESDGAAPFLLGIAFGGAAVLLFAVLTSPIWTGDARREGRAEAEEQAAIRACGLGELVRARDGGLLCIDHRAVIDP